MSGIDDWVKAWNDQVSAAEQWAASHPIESGFLIVLVSGLIIVGASKAADIWVHH